MTIPPTNQRISSVEHRDANQLLSILKQKNSEPNILTLDEFRKFAPLYTKPESAQSSPSQDAKLAALSQELQLKLDLYKPTHIVKSHHDKTVVLRLPQILTPLKTMTVTDANEKAVTANYNYRNSDLPKIWSTAQNLMTSALFQEQNTPDQVARIAQARLETKVIMTELNHAYGHGEKAKPADEAETPVASLPADAFEDL